MASIKISGLTEQTTASDTDLLPVASSAGTAKRMTLANFVTWLTSKLNSKFAPAGYGLGEAGGKKLTSADNINNIFSNGFYSWYDSAPVNAPSPYMVMVVYSSYFGNIVQEFYRLDMGKYSKCCRYYDNGTWEELEWVNPPMTLGVEYRTTERWNGKAVYTALIDCGAGPNGTFKSVAHGMQMSRAIRCVGQLSNGDSWPLTSWEGKHSDIYASIWDIYAWSDSDSSNYTLIAQMWYVKD